LLAAETMSVVSIKPTVLSQAEVYALLAALRNLKHRTLLTTI
jgi:hypothetical protein